MNGRGTEVKKKLDTSKPTRKQRGTSGWKTYVGTSITEGDTFQRLASENRRKKERNPRKEGAVEKEGDQKGVKILRNKGRGYLSGGH